MADLHPADAPHADALAVRLAPRLTEGALPGELEGFGQVEAAAAAPAADCERKSRRLGFGSRIGWLLRRWEWSGGVESVARRRGLRGRGPDAPLWPRKVLLA